MQINWPITARHLGAETRESLFEPCFNIQLGGKYLRELLAQVGEDKKLAASAYYIGPTRLTKSKGVPKRALDYLKKINDMILIILFRF